MINAAAMLVAMWAVWLLLTQRWTSLEMLAAAGGVALACVLIAARLGVVGGRGAFAAAPRLLMLAVTRSGSVVAGALSTLRSALAADVRLKPALVRVRTRSSSALAQAAFADLISATPGVVVVEADPDSLLVHVLQEDAIDGLALSQLETRVIGALDGRAPT
ncbi:MAG TPA: Na+/H+ antiporter subunit E [Caulobacterales bacterium]|nr:Na+/H+ antiporter subunit E [Caulobacterales bacterium]